MGAQSSRLRSRRGRIVPTKGIQCGRANRSVRWIGRLRRIGSAGVEGEAPPEPGWAFPIEPQLDRGSAAPRPPQKFGSTTFQLNSSHLVLYCLSGSLFYEHETLS